MSLRKIDAAIRSITGNIAKLNDQIQTTGLMILEHAREHGDCTRAIVLVKAMPASFRRQLLVDWIQRNSPIRISLTNDKVGMLKETAKGYTPFNIEAATAVPFYVQQDNSTGETKAFDFDSIGKGVENQAKRLQKAIEDGNVPEQDRASVEAAIAVLKALKFERVVEASDASNVELNPLMRAAA